MRLDLHLPNLQRVVHDGTANGAQQALERNRSTTLTRYFEVVRDEARHPLDEAALLGGPPAPELSYPDFPLWYRWDDGQRKWRRRRLRAYQVTSRMFTAHPREGERFYLRTLLNVVVGASSYEALRTVDGEVCATFREACDHLGLLDDDAEWRRCLAQATETEVPSLLRRLFVYIVAENGPAEPLALWNEFQDALADDFANDRCQTERNEVRAMDDAARARALHEIRAMFRDRGVDYEQLGLSPIPEQLPENGLGDMDDDEMCFVREALAFDEDDQQQTVDMFLRQCKCRPAECVSVCYGCFARQP